ncbi:hypothetical protein PAL_GLEAN10019466 [Pteropus alecto]|uniref:Uncharacterized protein n=1 Tax=Pteropus alecto TaxID=9402 RepID=L5JTS8_PTEAL|nr:hypothetical protein PAL_GLEAN10019466 [Pteropus alecto]
MERTHGAPEPRGAGADVDRHGPWRTRFSELRLLRLNTKPRAFDGVGDGERNGLGADRGVEAPPRRASLTRLASARSLVWRQRHKNTDQTEQSTLAHDMEETVTDAVQVKRSGELTFRDVPHAS